jgi:hypothetical protein
LPRPSPVARGAACSRGAQLPCGIDAVGERLGEMRAPDLAGAVEIGDRTGELQDPVKPPRRKMEAVRGFPDQGEAPGVELRHRLDDIGGRGGVGEDPRKTEPGITRDLDISCGGNAFRASDLTR